jgi:hypothetical protein
VLLITIGLILKALLSTGWIILKVVRFVNFCQV